MPDEPTLLDRAARILRSAPESGLARLRFHEAFAGAEVFLLLREDEADAVEPETVELGGVPHVLAFDRAERMAAFRSGPVATAALSGRALCEALAGQGVGVALNPGGEPLLISPENVDWLAETLADGPEEAEARPLELGPPEGVAPALLAALDRRLARGEGLAEAAWLARVTWADGSRGNLLAIVGARHGSEEALAAGVQAAVALSGVEGASLDVTFLAPDDPVVERLARVGLRFDLSAPPRAPEGPPRLR